MAVIGVIAVVLIVLAWFLWPVNTRVRHGGATGRGRIGAGGR